MNINTFVPLIFSVIINCGIHNAHPEQRLCGVKGGVTPASQAEISMRVVKKYYRAL